MCYSGLHASLHVCILQLFDDNRHVKLQLFDDTQEYVDHMKLDERKAIYVSIKHPYG